MTGIHTSTVNFRKKRHGHGHNFLKLFLLTHTGVHNVAWMRWGRESIGQGTAFLERVLVPNAECGMSAKHREGRGNDAMQHQPPIPAGPL